MPLTGGKGRAALLHAPVAERTSSASVLLQWRSALDPCRPSTTWQVEYSETDLARVGASRSNHVGRRVDAAPAAWAAALAAAHPALTLELYYGERGNLYSGCVRFAGGVETVHVGGPYDRFFQFDEDDGFDEGEYAALEA